MPPAISTRTVSLLPGAWYLTSPSRACSTILRGRMPLSAYHRSDKGTPRASTTQARKEVRRTSHARLSVLLSIRLVANLETVVLTCWRSPFEIDVPHKAVGRTTAYGIDERLQTLGRTFGPNLDRAIGIVAHPADDALALS